MIEAEINTYSDNKNGQFKINHTDHWKIIIDFTPN